MDIDSSPAALENMVKAAEKDINGPNKTAADLYSYINTDHSRGSSPQLSPVSGVAFSDCNCQAVCRQIEHDKKRAIKSEEVALMVKPELVPAPSCPYWHTIILVIFILENLFLILSAVLFCCCKK